MGMLEPVRRGQKLTAKSVNELRERSKPGGQVGRGYQLGAQLYGNETARSLARPIQCKAADDWLAYSVLCIHKGTSAADKKGIQGRFRVGSLSSNNAQTLAMFTSASRGVKGGVWGNLFPVTPWAIIRVIAAEHTTDEPEAAKMDGLADADVLPVAGDPCGPISVDATGEGEEATPGKTLFSKTRGGFVCVADGITQKIGGTEYKMLDVTLPAVPSEWWGNFTSPPIDFGDSDNEFVKCTLKATNGETFARWCRNGDGNIASGVYPTGAVLVRPSLDRLFYDIRQILGCAT